MSEPSCWGIYRGPNTDSIRKWQSPKCSKCNCSLTPWIAWWNYGCVGYCVDCNFFFIVKSHLRDADGVPLKAEVCQLERHEVVALDCRIFHAELNKKLWQLHENVHTSESCARDAYHLFCQVQDLNDQSVLLCHVIWSLILNSAQMSMEHVKEYLSFVLNHPHGMKVDGYYVWVGHEYDIAKAIDKSFGLDINSVIDQLYSGSSLSFSEFKERLRFYMTN